QANSREIRPKPGWSTSFSWRILQYSIETILDARGVRRHASGESYQTPLLFCRGWREVLKQFLHALIQILNILVGVIGERVARGASPKKLFRLGVEEVDDQCAYLICLYGGPGLSEPSASKSSPTPTSSKPVIKRVQGLLVSCDLHSYDRNIAARIHLSPACCRQRRVNRILDSIYIQRILGLNVFPRVGLVLPEVCAAIVIRLHLLC